MKVGISLGASAAGGASSHDSIDHMVWSAKFADEAGFDYIWTTEHHFTEAVHTGAPSAILAHFAAMTEHAKLGYAVAIVPLHHPLRLAEEFAWIDNLSKGRLVAGISPGWAAYEFQLFGVPHAERRERLAESFEIIKLALTNETFSFHGKYWDIPELKVYPPPRQQQIPFVMSCNQNETVARAARWKVGALLGFPPADVLAQQRQVYVDTCREEGYDDATIQDLLTHMGVRKFITIGRTEKEAEEVAMVGVRGLQGTLQRLLVVNGADSPVEGVVRNASGQAVSFEGPIEQTETAGNALYGTVDTVIEKILDLEKAGMNHIICGFGGRDPEALKLFAKEILPVVQKSGEAPWRREPAAAAAGKNPAKHERSVESPPRQIGVDYL